MDHFPFEKANATLQLLSISYLDVKLSLEPYSKSSGFYFYVKNFLRRVQPPRLLEAAYDETAM